MHLSSESANGTTCHGGKIVSVKSRGSGGRRGIGSLYRRADSDVWWATVNNGTKRVRFSTRTSNRAEAEAILAVAATRAAESRMQCVINSTVAAMNSGNPKLGPFDWARARWSSLNSRERQAIIFAMYQGTCFYCAKPVTIPEAREIKLRTRAVLDHRIPAIAGGPDSMDNIVLACHECNVRKHDKNPEHAHRPGGAGGAA